MALHKVVLEKVTIASDLRGAVQSVAAILRVEPRQAADLLKNLPLTLVNTASPEQAEKINLLFQDLGCTVRIVPPLPKKQESISVSVESIGKSSVIPRFTWWRAGLLVAMVIVIFVVGIQWGSDWILAQMRSQGRKPEEKIMHYLQQGSPELAQKILRTQPPRDSVAYLLTQAVTLVGMARSRMDQEGWINFGIGKEVPDNEQNLMDVPEMKEAMSKLDRALLLDPLNPQVHRWKAFALHQKGRKAAALRSALQALELDSTKVEFWNLVGVLQLETGQPGLADRSFRRALDLNPADGQALKNLGSLYFYHTADTLRGLQFLLRYCLGPGEKDLDRMTIRRDMMQAGWNLFNGSLNDFLPDTMAFRVYEPRRIFLQDKLRENPTATGHEELAILYLSRRQWIPAESELVKALELNPRLFSAARLLVVLLSRTGQWDRMRNLLRRAVGDGVNDPFFHKNLGVIEKYYDLSPRRAHRTWKEYLRLGGDTKTSLISSELRNSF